MVRAISRAICLLLALGLGLVLGGCANPLPGEVETVKFVDQPTPSEPPKEGTLTELALVDITGKTVKLNDFRGKSNVVLVILRGYVGSAEPGPDGKVRGSFCMYCSTQTARLISNYGGFQSRGAEVVVVFPIARKEDSKEIQTFAAKVQGEGKSVTDAPFPLLLDEGLSAVNLLGIAADLSKPSTYVLDKEGKVRFAYVGKNLADRPSIQAIFGELDRIR